jgi:hypothetical protein
MVGRHRGTILRNPLNDRLIFIAIELCLDLHRTALSKRSIVEKSRVAVRAETPRGASWLSTRSGLPISAII